MLKDKLNNIISGYKINQDDGDWLLALLDRVELYQELLMAVENKYPGETRQETALKYIRERESHNNCAASPSTIET